MLQLDDVYDELEFQKKKLEEVSYRLEIITDKEHTLKS
jgi:hypothetical protein